MEYQPKTGQRCTCKRGIQRDNCPACEGTGWRIDFAAIRNHRLVPESPPIDESPNWKGPRGFKNTTPGGF